MPCKFENSNKEMLAYYILYNVSLSQANVFTNFASNMKKDMDLLGVKIGMDNAILKHLAQRNGDKDIP